MTLIQAGYSVLVIDDAQPDSASRIAAGLLNPVTGPRLTLSPHYPHDWHYSIARYRALESQLSTPFLTEYPMSRLLNNASERVQLAQRLQNPLFASLVSPSLPPAGWQSEFGAITYPAHQLNMTVYLDAIRDFLKANKALTTTTVSLDDCIVETDTVRWGAHRFSALIFCSGARDVAQRWFSEIELKPAKGEIVEIECPGLSPAQIVNWGHWLCPSDTGLFKLGASAYWQWSTPEPDPKHVAHLVADLRSRLTIPFKVGKATAGIRPSARNRRAIYGFSRQSPRIGCITGLGGTGTITSPLIAERFVQAWRNTPFFPLRLL